MIRYRLSVNRTHRGKLSGDPPPISWGKYNRSFEIEELSLKEIAREIHDGYAFTAELSGIRRAENFISAQIIGVDFDTGDDASRLDTLERDPIIASYAAIIHTTSSHTEESPRGRALFFLDRPIRDAVQYARYAAALSSMFDKADQRCTDAARLWFGALDCEIRVYPDKVLPVSVLDEFLAHQEAARVAERAIQDELDVDLHIDPQSTLDEAIRRAKPGCRNDVGFQLARILRDGGLSKEEAWPYLQDYQIAVESYSDHPYTKAEAKASLNSAYTRRPRRAGLGTVDQDLRRMRWLAWNGRLGTKRGELHQVRNVLFAVADIMKKAGTTQEVEISSRTLAKLAGVGHSTTSRILKLAVEKGLLYKFTSDGRRANRYSLNRDMMGELASIPQREGLPNLYAQEYPELRKLAIFQRGARIDLRLWPVAWGTPPNDDSIGLTALSALAVLYTSSKHTGTDGTNSSGGDLSLASLSHPCRYEDDIPDIDSIKAWREVVGISERKMRQIASWFQAIGIIAYETGADGKSKRPYLTDDWHERLLQIEPLLTTYGHPELRAVNYEGNRVRFHDFCARHSRAEDKTYHSREADKARVRLEQAKKDLVAVNDRRQKFCEAQGIPFVPVSLHRRDQRSQQQETRVNGRRMGKEVKQKKLGLVTLNQKEATDLYLRIVRTINPTDGQKRRAENIARRHGLPAPIWERHELIIGPTANDPSGRLSDNKRAVVLDFGRTGAHSGQPALLPDCGKLTAQSLASGP